MYQSPPVNMKNACTQISGDVVLSTTKAKIIASILENPTKDPLNPYADRKDNPKVRKAMKNKIKKKFCRVYKTRTVTSVVSTILTKVPMTFRRKLPGTSLGAFKKAPKIKEGARLIYPSTLKVSKGIISDAVMTTPLKK